MSYLFAIFYNLKALLLIPAGLFSSMRNHARPFACKSGANPNISTREVTRTARQKEFLNSIPISDLERYTAALQETWTALREACAADNSEAINILLRAGASREGLGKQCEGKLPPVTDEYK